MTWALALAAWGGVIVVFLTVTRIIRRREHGGDLEALADAVREPRRLSDIVTAPGPVVHQCGCMPCPTHAAAQLARARAHMARQEWAAEWNERLR